MNSRYAIYFAPPEGSALEAFGQMWLGRDHITGEPVPQPRLDDFDPDEQAEMTRSARHYGFHATLRAPFELASDRKADELYAFARDFAARREPFHTSPLQVTAISKWIAFTLSEPSQSMDQLAADCVRDFEPFRAPLSQSDIERRRKSGLSDRQDQQLLAFGYPYIFEDFHFHMTLAGPTEATRQRRICDHVERIAPPIITDSSLLVDGISIYEQERRDLPFIQTARFAFGVPQSS